MQCCAGRRVDTAEGARWCRRCPHRNSGTFGTFGTFARSRRAAAGPPLGPMGIRTCVKAHAHWTDVASRSARVCWTVPELGDLKTSVAFARARSRGLAFVKHGFYMATGARPTGKPGRPCGRRAASTSTARFTWSVCLQAHFRPMCVLRVSLLGRPAADATSASGLDSGSRSDSVDAIYCRFSGK